jgi:glutamate N-acetyltransferase/amino-acid N-acetyltransferase
LSITRPLGFRAAATTAGLKKSGKSDLALIVCDDAEPTVAGRKGHVIEPRRSAAAIFTRNVVVGAPVQIGRAWRQAMIRSLREGASGQSTRPIRAVLVNAGAANAATGEEGVQDAHACMAAVARELKCERDEVLPSSTGVIGQRIPVDRITVAIPGLVGALARGDEADAGAAQAIMTTDLVPKQAHREIEIRGHQVHIGAIGKGSGMIAPRLDSSGLPSPAQATLLAFITTDACVGGAALQHALETAAHESFERISVDAHPSCSDTIVAMASGATPIKTIHEGSPEFHGFLAALQAVFQDLAEQVIRDGEGATRVFRVEVRGTRTAVEAERLARAVVDSPLVKCAVHGQDPNWGRIITAAGNAGVPFDPMEASLTIGGVEVYRDGRPTGVDRADPQLRGAMSAPRVEMELVVGAGDGRAWMLGCDLSRDYVRINADYTT